MSEPPDLPLICEADDTVKSVETKFAMTNGGAQRAMCESADPRRTAPSISAGVLIQRTLGQLQSIRVRTGVPFAAFEASAEGRSNRI